MAKLRKHVELVKDTEQLHRRLIELSVKEGGAWSFTIMPFSHEVHFFGADSPSKLPDSLMESTRNWGKYPIGRIGYKGKLIGFSEKVFIREQNRGIGRD
jgi:hypothetical protein